MWIALRSFLSDGLIQICNNAFCNTKINEIGTPESVRSIEFGAFPYGTIVRLHGSPPKFSFVDWESNHYIIFVPRNKAWLYEKDEDWQDIIINTY